MSKLIGRLLAVLAFGWAGSASADLIRYDISGKSDDYTLGSMWFWDAGPTPGNIMPNLYKWSFNYDDRAPINHLNSSLSESFGSAFTVGHAGEVLPPDTYFCFDTTLLDCSDLSAHLNSGVPILALGNLGDGNGVIMTAWGIGEVDISAPIQVPTPATIPLLGIALAALGFSRRKRNA